LSAIIPIVTDYRGHHHGTQPHNVVTHLTEAQPRPHLSAIIPIVTDYRGHHQTLLLV